MRHKSAVTLAERAPRSSADSMRTFPSFFTCLFVSLLACLHASAAPCSARANAKTPSETNTSATCTPVATPATRPTAAATTDAGRASDAPSTSTTSNAPSKTHLADGDSPRRNSASIDVIVRGSRYRPPVSSRDPTAASTVLSGEPLDQAGATAADILAHVAGVQVTRAGAGSDLATASVRGATSAQTPVFVAGIVVNDDVAGTADLSTIPLWILDRVEVFRGHAPDDAGVFGIGGAILFEPKLPRRSQLGVGVGAGSFGHLSDWLAGSVAAGESASLVALRRSQARNDYSYENDGGTRFDPTDDRITTRQNADFSAHDAWAISRHRLAPSTDITLLAHAFVREQGVTGLAVIPALHARARYQRFLAGITANTACDSVDSLTGTSRCHLTMSNSVVSAATHTHDPALELGLQSTRVFNDAVRFTHRARWQYDLTNTLTLSAQGSASVEQLAVISSGPIGLHAKRSTFRVGTSAIYHLSSAVTTHAILGGECHNTQGPGDRSYCGVLQPYARAGASWSATRWFTVLLNAGRYVRVPTLAELYGTSPTVRGTSGLAPENGISADIGARAVRDPRSTSTWTAYAEAFGFTRLVSNLIAFERTSFGVVRPFNVGRSLISGVEANAGAVLFDHVHARFSATVLDPRDRSSNRTVSNDILPFRSKLVMSHTVELFAQHAMPSIHLDRTSISATVHYAASRFADPAGLIVIGPQTTVDLEASAKLLENIFTLRIAARNLLNAHTFDTVGFPLAGRSFHASLDCWF